VHALAPTLAASQEIAVILNGASGPGHGAEEMERLPLEFRVRPRALQVIVP
jgi:hypothetical protein